MPTALIELPELPGQKFQLEEGQTLDDARRAALQLGLATAEQLFPRPDVAGATEEAVAQVARDLPIGEAILAGTRGRLGALAAPLTGQTEFEARERGPINTLMQERGAAQVGAVLPDIAAFGRLGARGGITGEGVAGGLAAPPGDTAIGVAEGAGGALGGELVGRGVGLGLRGLREGVQATLQRARELAGPDPRIPRGGPEVQPVESAQDLLDRARATSDQLIEAQGLTVTGDVNVPDERARLVGRADDLGFQLSTGQRTGDVGQQQLDAGFASNPLTSRPFVEAAEGNNRQYARTLLRAIGEPAGDAVTPQAIGNARERMAGEFSDIAGDLGPDALGGQRVRLTGDLQKAIQGELSDPRIAASSASGIPLHLQGKTVSPTLQNMIDTLDTGEAISGEQLMAWRSALTDDVARFSEQGSGALGTATKTANEAINAIDDAIVRGAGDDVAERYVTARSQFRVLQATENVLRDPLGEVSAKRMNTELLRNYPLEYRRAGLTGANPGTRDEQLQNVADFFDATRIGAGILPEVVGNSGTPTRQFVTLMMNQASEEGVTGTAARLGRQALLGDVAGQVAFNRGRAVGGPSPVIDALTLPQVLRSVGGAEASAQEVLRANQQSLLDQFFGPDDE